MGLPIVATDIRGCRQVVDDGITGLLVPPRDPRALAAAIGELAGDARAAGAGSGGAAARRRVREFDDRRCIEITLETYRRLLVAARVRGGRARVVNGAPRPGRRSTLRFATRRRRRRGRRAARGADRRGLPRDARSAVPAPALPADRAVAARVRARRRRAERPGSRAGCAASSRCADDTGALYREFLVHDGVAAAVAATRGVARAPAGGVGDLALRAPAAATTSHGAEVLATAVAADYGRRGIGSRLVRRGRRRAAATRRGIGARRHRGRERRRGAGLRARRLPRERHRRGAPRRRRNNCSYGPDRRLRGRGGRDAARGAARDPAGPRRPSPGPLKVHARPVPYLGGARGARRARSGRSRARGRRCSSRSRSRARWGSPTTRPISRRRCGSWSRSGSASPPRGSSAPHDAGHVVLGVMAVLVLVNAVNLLDGLDGLAAGVAAFGAIGFVRRAVGLERDARAGARRARSAGFLVWNAPPARVYLGDAGSYLIGTALAMLFVAASQHHAAVVSGAFLFVGVPVADTTVAIVRRLRARTPLLRGDRGHVYDQLVDRGWSSKLAVRGVRRRAGRADGRGHRHRVADRRGRGRRRRGDRRRGRRRRDPRVHLAARLDPGSLTRRSRHVDSSDAELWAGSASRFRRAAPAALRRDPAHGRVREPPRRARPPGHLLPARRRRAALHLDALRRRR